MKSRISVYLVLIMLTLVAANALAGQSAKSWEFSAGVGASSGYAQSVGLLPTGTLRLGYNISNHVGVAVGVSAARAAHGSSYVMLDGPTYVTPSISATLTATPLPGVRPFVSVGMQSSTIAARWTSTRSSGTQFGAGVLLQVGPRSALRIDAARASSTHAATVTVGWSFFTDGCR
jgi:hypothetical protein